MPSSSTEHFSTLWVPRRPLVSFSTRLPVIVASSVFLGFLPAAFIDDQRWGLVVAISIAALTTVHGVATWWFRAARRVLVSSDSAIGVRVGSKIVFEVPWTEIAAVKLDKGDTLPSLLLDVTGHSGTYPHLALTSTDRWANDIGSPDFIAFLPGEYQELAGALAEECRRRAVPFSCD
ncbi:hypothetical protein [Aeromicrobium sp. UC242_57]|uniref:hypothetical protein n=1 Tax=Aeromicrobium sp. UC242_57 TaxID=3374624 RepID=UPI0037A75F2E